MNWSRNLDTNYYLFQITNSNIVLRWILWEEVKTNLEVVQQGFQCYKSQSCDLNTIVSAKMLLTTLPLPLLTPPTGSVFIDILVLICYLCHDNITELFQTPH